MDDFMCHRCMARKKGTSPDMWYSNFARTAEHRKTMISNEEFMANYGQRTPLMHIPGMHITRIVFDMMHCMELGFLQVLIPSLLACLVRYRSSRYPGHYLNDRYASAYVKYRRWCFTNKKVKTIVRKTFTSKVWNTGEGGYPRVSQLTAKAAAMRSLMYWFGNEIKRDTASEKRMAGPLPAAGSPATQRQAMLARPIRLKIM